MKVRWNHSNEGKLQCWVDHGKRRISPYYPTLGHCQAFIDGIKTRQQMYRETFRAREARMAELEERSHNEALEDALGPHGQG